MKLAMQLGALVVMVSTVSSAAETWSGYIVDSKCYEGAQRNVNPWATSAVDRDVDLDIKLCAPAAKTKSFGLVQKDTKILKFDPAGNTKASEIVHNTAKQNFYLVTIAGDMDRDILKVDSISMTK
jgi:hypothetical protein